MGLERRALGIVCINVRAYGCVHEACAPEARVGFHAALVELLLAAAQPRGTLDGIVGDRGRALFNAASPCGG